MRVEISTINLDQSVCAGKQQADLVELITARDPEVILVQEAQNLNLRKYIPTTYTTNQVMDSESTRASAIIWKKAVFDEIRSENVKVGEKNIRYISSVNLANKTGGRRTRVICVKVPDGESAGPIMASSLIAVYQGTGINNFIMGGDFQYNMSTDPYKIAKKTKLSVRYHRQEGFYLPAALNPSATATTGPRLNSDHIPVTITVDM